MNIASMLQQLAKIRLTDCLDILVVTFLIYKLLPLLRTTGIARIAKVVAAVLIIALVADLLNLHTMGYLFSKLLEIGVIAAVILFQPELRRMVDHVGSLKLSRMLGDQGQDSEMLSIIDQTVIACEAMSREKVGALIVFSRRNRLDEFFKTGTMIQGNVSEQLLRNLFFLKAPLHDGAVIIQDGQVAAAGCVLPLSSSERIHGDLGTRHRAGLGVSEVSDCVTVIVSEETGAISVAVGGILKRYLAPQTLEKLLRNELCPEENTEENNLFTELRRVFTKKNREGQEK